MRQRKISWKTKLGQKPFCYYWLTNMMALSLVCLFLPLLLAVLSSGNIPPPSPPQFVYRADDREPLSIFQTGMQSYGTCENVFYHVQGRNCRERTSAFISTTSNEKEAENIVKIKLANDPKKQNIYVYKIRADQRFYSAGYSLLTAADKYSKAGNAKEAQKYRDLAELYKSQEEWMAYKDIPYNMIQQATNYSRNSVNLNKKGAVVPITNRYVDANTFANQEPFPESNKGCTPEILKILQACKG